MLRTALSVGLAAYVALATVDGQSSGSAPCSQPCSDDDPLGDCGADCSDCSCCSHLRLSFAVIEVKAAAATEGEPVPEHRQREPESPEPGDILHVPIAQLA